MRVISLSMPRIPRLNLLARISMALALRRQRKLLLLLDATQLSDIGLTADQAIAEFKRPIWDAPPHWRL
jgi:uncharacterized protein YjiS (DUF1127 family)